MFDFHASTFADQAKNIVNNQLPGIESEIEPKELAVSHLVRPSRSLNVTSTIKQKRVLDGYEKSHFIPMKSETNIDIQSNIAAGRGGYDKDSKCQKMACNDYVGKIGCSSLEELTINNSAKISHDASESSNLLDQLSPSQEALQQYTQSTCKLLQQPVQGANNNNVFFDFLHKCCYTGHKISHIKEFIDKQLAADKIKSKLKNENTLTVSDTVGSNQHSFRHKSKFLKTCKKRKITPRKLKTNNDRNFKNEKKRKKVVSNTKSNTKLVINGECNKAALSRIIKQESPPIIKTEPSCEKYVKNNSNVDNAPLTTSMDKNDLNSEKKTRRKRRKNVNNFKNEKSISNEEIKPLLSCPVSDILHGIESVQITDEQFEPYVHSLTSFLTHPLNSPDMSSLIYHVVKFLHCTKENYLIKFFKNYPVNYCLPSPEVCIVKVLFSIEKESNPNMQFLIKTVLHVLFRLILTKVRSNVYGLASMCRVVAEICKQKSDKAQVLSLCCNLIKQKHPFAPFLIASIVTVWRELFVITDSMPEEDVLLLKSISFGFQKKPNRITTTNWNCISELLAGLFPSATDGNKSIEFLKDRILLKCLENTFEDLWKLTTPFVIFVAHMPWDWINVHVVHRYIIPNLQRFSRQVSNEQAFEVFCNLFVEIFLLNPKIEEQTVLDMLYKNISLTGKDFVLNCIAVSLLKYFILSERTVPSFLKDWLKMNQENPKVLMLKKLFQERLMSENQAVLLKQDIVI